MVEYTAKVLIPLKLVLKRAQEFLPLTGVRNKSSVSKAMEVYAKIVDPITKFDIKHFTVEQKEDAISWLRI